MEVRGTAFLSVEDLKLRAHLGAAVVDMLRAQGALEGPCGKQPGEPVFDDGVASIEGYSLNESKDSFRRSQNPNVSETALLAACGGIVKMLWTSPFGTLGL